MLNVSKLATKPNIFHSLTGVSPTKFKLLLQKLEVLWQESEFKRKNYSGRKRKICGGRKRKLTLEQSLFLLLMYYRTYVNHLFLGMVGNIDDSKICKYFALLEPLLAQEFRVSERKINLSKEEILELIVDATEQPSQKRPGSGYSGKKKRQTIKTQIHVNIQGKIKSVSKSYAGNIHDKKVYDQSRTIVTIQDNPSKVNNDTPRGKPTGYPIIPNHNNDASVGELDPKRLRRIWVIWEPNVKYRLKVPNTINLMMKKKSTTKNYQKSE